jgi:hypothetical protein
MLPVDAVEHRVHDNEEGDGYPVPQRRPRVRGLRQVAAHREHTHGEQRRDGDGVRVDPRGHMRQQRRDDDLAPPRFELELARLRQQ